MSSESITFPRNWKQLSEDEQKEWILNYYMAKTKIPEQTTMKLRSGAKIKFPTKSIVVSKKNPNIIREFEYWVDKWLVTVFIDKRSLHYRYIGISNPNSAKWLAQELNSEILNKLFIAILKIKHKYGLWNRKKAKSQRKKRDFPLSIRYNSRGEAYG